MRGGCRLIAHFGGKVKPNQGTQFRFERRSRRKIQTTAIMENFDGIYLLGLPMNRIEIYHNFDMLKCISRAFDVHTYRTIAFYV